MLGQEEVFTIKELAEKLPRLDGRRIHIASLYRWCRRGVRGVQLEHVMLGGRIMSSLEAVERFGERVAEAPCTRGPRGPRARRQTCRSACRPAERRAEEIQAAREYLEEVGI